MNMHPQGGVANPVHRPSAGVDVSKRHLDACVNTDEQRVVNDETGWDALVAKFKQTGVELVVVEATGGYERPLVCALQSACITVARVNPRQARDFAKSMGVRAKTDRVDARCLRDFADVVSHHADRAKYFTAVHERLVKEINFWQDRAIKLKDDVAADKQPRLNYDNALRTLDEITARLQSRTAELQTMRHVISSTPVVLGGALIIPAGLLAQRRGEPGWSADAAARARVERMAMEAVMAAERALGHEVFDVSAQECGWDITALRQAVYGRLLPPRHVEVKGRVKGAGAGGEVAVKHSARHRYSRQEKRLHKGGVGPEMRSPAGFDMLSGGKQ